MISELDNTGVIEDNDKDLPEDGDESKEVTEEMMDSADEKRSAAMAAFSEGRSVGGVLENKLVFSSIIFFYTDPEMHFMYYTRYMILTNDTVNKIRLLHRTVHFSHDTIQFQ